MSDAKNFNRRRNRSFRHPIEHQRAAQRPPDSIAPCIAVEVATVRDHLPGAVRRAVILNQVDGPRSRSRAGSWPSTAALHQVADM